MKDLSKANAPRDEINQVLGATHLELGCWALLGEDVIKVESQLRQQNSLERCEPLEQARNGCTLRKTEETSLRLKTTRQSCSLLAY